MNGELTKYSGKTNKQFLPLRYFIFFLLIGAFISLVVMMRNLSGTVERLSKEMILESVAITENELQSFFSGLIEDISIEKERGTGGYLRNMDIEKLNSFFLPYMKRKHHIFSVIYANNKGDVYMLLKHDTVWQNRVIYRGSTKSMPTITSWRLNDDGKLSLIDRYPANRPYDPRNRPWFEGLDSMTPGEVLITEPYKFFTTKEPGLTISTKWEDPVNQGVYHYLAYEILITDISLFTTGLSKTPNQKIVVLTKDKRRLIGLPREDRYHTVQDMKPYILQPLSVLKDTVINTAREVFMQARTDSIVSFRLNREKYWAGVRYVHIGANRIYLIAVIIPESDFLGNIKSTKQMILGGFGLILLSMIIMVYAFILKHRANQVIALERDKNEHLLLNTLPLKVVNDLKTKGVSEPQKFNEVTVFFSDIVGFTRMSANLDPKQLISELNDIYTNFDEIITKNHCERIKTIGDAYMAVCGMPDPDKGHAENILKAAIQIVRYLNKRNRQAELKWRVRIGMHSGTVVGGIVGVKKYIYDVFGDTINIASRLENSSEPMRINISESTYKLVMDSDVIKDLNLKFTFREAIDIKGKGKMNMYFVDLA